MSRLPFSSDSLQALGIRNVYAAGIHPSIEGMTQEKSRTKLGGRSTFLRILMRLMGHYSASMSMSATSGTRAVHRRRPFPW